MEALIKRHLNRMQTVRLDFVRSMMDEIDEEYVLGNKIPLWLFGFLY